MMSEEKQIEEMARALCGEREHTCEECDSCNNCEFWIEATVLYNAGYRKQSEGEWIRAENPPEEYRDECGELIPFWVCCQGTVYPFRAMYD